MSLSISSYNPRPYVSNVELPEYDFNLIAKVMQSKQDKFDKNYAALKSYKQTAVNIQFLNKEYQKDVDGYNKDLNDKFNAANGDFGDLADNNSFNKAVSWFDKFKDDTSLISAYKTDKKWQESLGDMESKKNGKDPYKNGYSQTNELVFKYDLTKYMSAKKGEEVPFTGYIPYVDVLKAGGDLWKSLPKKKLIEDVIMGDGTIKTITKDGYSAAEIQNLMGSLTPDVQNQLAIEAKADFIKGKMTNALEYKNQLSSKYDIFLKTEEAQYKELYDNASKNILIEKDPEKKQKYIEAKTKLESILNNIPNNKRSIDWFNNASDEELLSVATQMHTKEKLAGIGDSLAGTVSIQYKQDPTYFSRLQTQIARDRLTADEKYRWFKLNEDNKFRQAEFAKNNEHEETDLKIKAMNAMGKKNKNGKKSDGDNEDGENGVYVNTGDTAYKGGNEEQSLDHFVFQIEGNRVETAKAAYNIFEGNPNLKVAMGSGETGFTEISTDSLLQKIIEKYETESGNGKNPAMGIKELERFGKENNLSGNKTFNMLVNSINKLYPKINKGETKHKVGAIKELFTNFFNGKDDENNLGFLSEEKVAYENLKNYELTQESVLNATWNKAKKEHPEWDISNKETAKTMYLWVMNDMMKNEKTMAYKRNLVDYNQLSKSPTKETASLFRNREELAANIREATGFYIDPNIISHSETAFDGTTMVKFKDNLEDFKKELVPNVRTYMGAPIKGKIAKGSTLLFKREPEENVDLLNQTTYDRSGTISQYIKFKDNGFQVKFYKSGTGTTIVVNNEQFRINNTENMNISDIKEEVGNVISEYASKLK